LWLYLWLIFMFMHGLNIKKKNVLTKHNVLNHYCIVTQQ
jgi:hypothetical protein